MPTFWRTWLSVNDAWMNGFWKLNKDKAGSVKHHVGIALQFIVLTATPLISWWQLQFGFNLIWMPGLLSVAAVLFWIGTRLRESR